MNPEASNWSTADISDWLREGIAAAKSGQRERARELLTRVVTQDEENISAWWWLSGVVDSLDDRELCLENVLTLDPDNGTARAALGLVHKQKGALVPSSTGTAAQPPQAQEAPSPVKARAAKPVTLAAALLQEDLARRRPPPAPEPELPPVPLHDEFDDQYLCPYCAATTDPEDRSCSACGKSLWLKVRRREERSSWLWLAMTVQAIAIVWPAIIGLLALYFVARQAGLSDPWLLIPVYLGLPGDVSPEMADAVFARVPRLYFLLFLVQLLFSLAVLVGLFLRWKPIFYLFLVNVLLLLMSSVVGMASGQLAGVLCGGSGALVAFGGFFLVLQLADDFFLNEKRILLRFDRDATNGPALMASGRRYAKLRMWAMAAKHLRAAVSKMPHEVDGYLALAVAYINLKRYDLTGKVLGEARRLQTNDPRVEGLESLLAKQRFDQD